LEKSFIAHVVCKKKKKVFYSHGSFVILKCSTVMLLSTIEIGAMCLLLDRMSVKEKFIFECVFRWIHRRWQHKASWDIQTEGE